MNPVTHLVTVLYLIQLTCCSNHLNKDKNQLNQQQQQQLQPVTLAKSESSIETQYSEVESTGVHIFALPDEVKEGQSRVEAAESHHHSKHYKHHKHHKKGKHEGKYFNGQLIMREI